MPFSDGCFGQTHYPWKSENKGNDYEGFSNNVNPISVHKKGGEKAPTYRYVREQK